MSNNVDRYEATIVSVIIEMFKYIILENFSP